VYRVGLEEMSEKSTKITTRRRMSIKGEGFTSRRTAHLIKWIKRTDRTVSTRSLRIAVRMVTNRGTLNIMARR
jgi:hypothetical protein